MESNFEAILNPYRIFLCSTGYLFLQLQSGGRVEKTRNTLNYLLVNALIINIKLTFKYPFHIKFVLFKTSTTVNNTCPFSLNVKKIKLEILGLSPSQSQAGSFALVLGEELGNRRLPIIIGVFEAQAIAVQIENIVPNRPMTHDLFKSFADGMNYTLKEIVISDLKEGIFYAKIICTDSLREVEIDARPSDAIAIGLRFAIPIYTYEAILSEAGIVSSSLTEEEEDDDTVRETIRATGSKDQLRDMPFDELQRMLDDALSKEDYEKAAKIRDEMGRRN
jgi:bifunctional DNase/RNase